MTTHFVLRHFEKKKHPLQNVPLEAWSWWPRVMQRGYVRLWQQLDASVVGLNSKGRIQGMIASECIEAYVRSFHTTLAGVIASPYRRTHTSARLVAQARRLSLRLDQRLAELDHGARAEYGLDELCVHFPRYADQLTREHYLHVLEPYANETHAMAMRGRLSWFLRDLSSERHSQLIVTHKGVMDCLYQLAYQLSDDEVVERFSSRKGPEYGSVFVFRLTEAGKIEPLSEYLQLC